MRVLKVGFDNQIFMAQKRGGISKYFVELATRLPNFGVSPVFLTKNTNNIHLSESGLVPSRGQESTLLTNIRWANWRVFGSPSELPKNLTSIDLMHHTFTHQRYLKLWPGKRVVTVFDMIPEIYPEYFRPFNPHLAKRKYCYASDQIISISQSTLSDINDVYGQEFSEKVSIVPFGVGEEFFRGSTNLLILPENYFLFVGVRKGYKDFPLAFEAFSILAREDTTLNFVVVGGGPFSRKEQSLISTSGLSNRVKHLHPTDEEMPEVYSRAQIFLFPSRYEGFGLPTLESLASKTVTVLADASCSREVGGKAALYFKAGDIGDLIQTVRGGLTQERQASAKILGPERARLFSWDRVANETAQIYHNVLKG